MVAHPQELYVTLFDEKVFVMYPIQEVIFHGQRQIYLRKIFHLGFLQRKMEVIMNQMVVESTLI